MSRAVVLYTHWVDKPSPRHDSDAVIAEFGAQRGPELLVEVAELFREANLLEVDWTSMTLAEGGDYMRSVTAKRHPELTDEALDAMRWKWTFDWR